MYELRLCRLLQVREQEKRNAEELRKKFRKGEKPNNKKAERMEREEFVKRRISEVKGGIRQIGMAHKYARIVDSEKQNHRREKMEEEKKREMEVTYRYLIARKVKYYVTGRLPSHGKSR